MFDSQTGSLQLLLVSWNQPSVTVTNECWPKWNKRECKWWPQSQLGSWATHSGTAHNITNDQRVGCAQQDWRVKEKASKVSSNRLQTCAMTFAHPGDTCSNHRHSGHGLHIHSIGLQDGKPCENEEDHDLLSSRVLVEPCPKMVPPGHGSHRSPCFSVCENKVTKVDATTSFLTKGLSHDGKGQQQA